MKFFNWLLLIPSVALPVLAQKPPENLVIESYHKPADCSVKAKIGDSIRVHYTGTLWSTGEKFDSSRDRPGPLALTLGVGQVFKGWDIGLQGMCLREKRKLTIPSHLAYGAKGFGSKIPPDSPLILDIELVSLRPRPTHDHDEL